MNCMECFVDYVGIGKRIRKARKGRKWTQAELAEAVGCSTANITNIEKAKTKLSLNMMVRIAAVLEISVDEIIGTANTLGWSVLSPIEAGLREICMGLSPEDAQLCQQACIEFCTAFSRHLARA